MAFASRGALRQLRQRGPANQQVGGTAAVDSFASSVSRFQQSGVGRGDPDGCSGVHYNHIPWRTFLAGEDTTDLSGTRSGTVDDHRFETGGLQAEVGWRPSHLSLVRRAEFDHFRVARERKFAAGFLAVVALPTDNNRTDCIELSERTRHLRSQFREANSHDLVLGSSGIA